MTAPDFNADGKLDLAATARDPSRAVVYFGNGDGSFGNITEILNENPVPDFTLYRSPPPSAGG